MRVVIDRFEGEFAVVELPDRTTANIPLVLVPDAREGDVIDITIDREAAKKLGKKAGELMNELWQ